MAVLTSITDSADPSTWGVTTKTQVVVDCDSGSVVIEVRRGNTDTVPKMLSDSTNGAGIELAAGRRVILDNPVVGHQYRVRTATPGKVATATISEADA